MEVEEDEDTKQKVQHQRQSLSSSYLLMKGLDTVVEDLVMKCCES